MPQEFTILYADYDKPITRFKHLLKLIDSILKSDWPGISSTDKARLSQLLPKMQEFNDVNMKQINDLIEQINKIDEEISAIRSNPSRVRLAILLAPNNPKKSKGFFSIFRYSPTSVKKRSLDPSERYDEVHDAIERLNKRSTDLRQMVVAFLPDTLALCAEAKNLLDEINPTLTRFVPAAGDYRLSLALT